jgi:hypothetical protein
MYSVIFVGYSGSYDLFRSAVSFPVSSRIQLTLSVLIGSLKLLGCQICLQHPRRLCSMFLDLSSEYLNMNFGAVVSEIQILFIWSQLLNNVTLWIVLESLTVKFWLSFEYKSCSLFSIDGYGIFNCCLCYCGTKVIKMGSSNAAVVWLKCLLFYQSIGWSVSCFAGPLGWGVELFYLLIVL